MGSSTSVVKEQGAQGASSSAADQGLVITGVNIGDKGQLIAPGATSIGNNSRLTAAGATSFDMGNVEGGFNLTQNTSDLGAIQAAFTFASNNSASVEKMLAGVSNNQRDFLETVATLKPTDATEASNRLVIAGLALAAGVVVLLAFKS